MQYRCDFLIRGDVSSRPCEDADEAVREWIEGLGRDPPAEYAIHHWDRYDAALREALVIVDEERERVVRFVGVRPGQDGSPPTLLVLDCDTGALTHQAMEAA